MPTDPSLQALLEAAPRRQPGFDELLARHEALRARITATPAPARPELGPRARRRQVIGLSAAAAAVFSVAGAITGLTMSAASPPSAYAAAKKALAATTAAASGTMTLTAGTWTLDVTRWHGHNIAMSSGRRHLLGPNRQLLLVAGGAYLQAADGSWRHYRTASKVGPKLAPMVQRAHANVAGTTAEQILRLSTGLHKTVRRNGTTLYTGTIPNRPGYPAFSATYDDIMGMINNLRSGNEPGAPGGYHTSMQLRMIVGRDGLVKKISLIFRQHGMNCRGRLGVSCTPNPADSARETWSVTYSHLGSTPPITAPTTPQRS